MACRIARNTQIPKEIGNTQAKNRAKAALLQAIRYSQFVIPWVLGYLGTWVLGCLGTWVLGYLGTWVLGYLGIWVFGYLGIWVLGYLGIWVLGYFSGPYA
ncbi:MAG: hypothetical protein ACI856_002442, partial [Kiritimatiellia bacterium]